MKLKKMLNRQFCVVDLPKEEGMDFANLMSALGVHVEMNVFESMGVVQLRVYADPMAVQCVLDGQTLLWYLDDEEGGEEE